MNLEKVTRHFKESQIQEAADLLRSGGLVVFPTETVWGLGANALDSEACLKIFEAKGRPGDNPLIVHIGRAEDVDLWAAGVPQEARKLIEAFWPGPLTLILPKNPLIGDAVTGGQKTVGLRFPSHPLAQALIRAAGVPVAAPSANRSGQPSPTHFDMAWKAMNGRVEGILEGDSSQKGLESTIVGFSSSGVQILRPGSVTREDLEAVLGSGVVFVGAQGADVQTPVTPGMKYPHYKPQAQIVLFDHASEIDPSLQFEKVGVMGLKLAGVYPESWTVWSFDTLEDWARHLFARFYESDELALDRIYVKIPSGAGLGAALLNRLEKAAQISGDQLSGGLPPAPRQGAVQI